MHREGWDPSGGAVVLIKARVLILQRRKNSLLESLSSPLRLITPEHLSHLFELVFYHCSATQYTGLISLISDTLSVSLCAMLL